MPLTVRITRIESVDRQREAPCRVVIRVAAGRDPLRGSVGRELGLPQHFTGGPGVSTLQRILGSPVLANEKGREKKP